MRAVVVTLAMSLSAGQAGRIAAWETASEPAAAHCESDVAGTKEPTFHSDRLDRARLALDAAMDSYRELLDRQDSPSRDGWLAYLHWDELATALGGPVDERLRALADLTLRLRGDIVGLEADEAVILRQAASDYSAQLRLTAADTPRRLQQAEQLLADALASDSDPSALEADRIGAAVGLLEQAGRSPQLVEAARLRWTYPNVWVRVDTAFADKYVARDFSDSRMQQNVILGTQTRGPVATQGRLELATVPNDDVAQFELRLTGSTRSSGNVGRNGPAVIYSSARSQFAGIKRFYFHPLWGVADAPAGVRVDASIGIKRIDVEPRVLPGLLQPVVQRAAWSKANENHAAAEQEVERLTGRRIEQRVESELAGPLETVRDYYRQYVVERPLRLGDVPTVVSRSTAAYFEIGIRQAGRAQVSASARVPKFYEGTKIGGMVHQSLFNNASGRTLFNDCVFTDEEVESQSQFVAMHVPPPLRVYSTSVPWSVACDIERPATFQFDDGRVDLTIHSLQWKIGEKAYTRPIDIHVRYRVENTLLGMLFTREGDMQVRAVDGRPWTTAEQSELLPFIKEKCGALFQEQGRFNSLILPRGEGFGPLGEIRLGQVECDNGWFVMGYQ